MKEIIQALQAQKAELTAQLTAQLTKIDNAIAALQAISGTTVTASASAPAAPAKGKPGRKPKAAAVAAPAKGKRGRKPKAAVEAAPAAVAEAPAPVAAAAPAKKRGPKPKAAGSAKEIRLVKEYADAKTWNEKVVYLLSTGGSLTADTIASKIAALEPGVNAEKMKTMISSIASTLAKKGGIKAVRVGRGFEYSL